MADVTRTKVNTRPLTGFSSRKGLAGGTLEGGEAVYLDGANGWKPADADAAASANAKGVVVQKDVVSGGGFDIVTRGPMPGYSGMTPGVDYFVSTSPGEICPYADLGSGDYPCRIGWAESATVLFVDPAPVGAVLS